MTAGGWRAGREADAAAGRGLLGDQPNMLVHQDCPPRPRTDVPPAAHVPGPVLFCSPASHSCCHGALPEAQT